MPDSVRGLVQATLTSNRLPLTFGLYSKGIASWHLFLGRKGRCLWVIGEDDRGLNADEGDPPFYAGLQKNAQTRRLQNPRVVLFQDFKPRWDHPVWKEPQTELIMWVGSGMRRQDKAPPGWVISRRRMFHQELGGVSNGTFTVWRAQRVNSSLKEWKAAEHYGNTLRQVMDPTQSGTPCRVPASSSREESANRLNTVDGVLDWESRFKQRVTTPTVFSKTHWVKRRLSTKELCQVLDIPGARAKGWTDKELADIVKATQIPGKVVARALEWRDGGNTPLDKELDLEKPEGKRRVNLETEGGSPNKKVKWLDQARPTGKGKDQEGHSLESGRTDNLGKSDNEQAGKARQNTSTVSDKAVKSDDAEVPTHLWNNRILKRFPWITESGQEIRAISSLNVIRRVALRFWKRKVARDFEDWFVQQQTKDSTLNKESEVWKAGRRAIGYAWCANWWEWTHGSHLFFWRWPKFYLEEARLGVPPRFDLEPPKNQEKQPPYQDESNRKVVQGKVGKVIHKGYITVGSDEMENELLAYMFMFDVPKGPTDARIVYDGSKSGLNDALWSPWFSLPTVDTMTRSLMDDYWCADNDYGEQFLNFPLHPDLQKYCGVDLSQLYPEQAKRNGGSLPGKWTRSAMGLKVSPYNAVQGALICKLMILSKTEDPDDPYHWELVVVNMPGSEDYDARLPWIYKVRKDGMVACDIHQYIDDLRITGPDSELVWRASSRAAKLCAWLGLQDAARKRRQPSKTPGAWAGATVSTDKDGVYKSVTLERWEKTRAKVRWLAYQAGEQDNWTWKHHDKAHLEAERAEMENGQLLHKTAESHRGFLIYVSRTFKSMVPYLKGLHLTLDSWREGRDEEGWKSARSVEAKFDTPVRNKAPKTVRMVRRFREDMKALMRLTASENPPSLRVRPQKTSAVFMVGDASGSGFGDSTWMQGSEAIQVAHGAWSKSTSGESSNYREAFNLILHLERALESGEIPAGSEIFIFTDNSTAEKTFYKGSSKSKTLHELALRLRELEMQGTLTCHFVWIAGTRMIAQGTDGLSRGDLTSGVMNGDQFLKYIPLNERALDRQKNLKRELLEASPGKWQVLEQYAEWYKVPLDLTRSVEQGLIWSPPPCLADVALELLCEAKHIFPNSKHIFVCPALMTGRWRKQLGKVADVMLTLPVGSTWWTRNQYEPLVIALICPLLSHSPWRVKRCEWVALWEHSMRSVWSQGGTAVRNSLLQFWQQSGPGNARMC